jgi:hypothetical protein
LLLWIERVRNSPTVAPSRLLFASCHHGSAATVSGHEDAFRLRLATSTDGYKAVISTGEMVPNFGNKPDLAAIKDINRGLPGADSVARLMTMSATGRSSPLG